MVGWEASDVCSMGLSFAVASGVDPDLGRSDARIDPFLVARSDTDVDASIWQGAVQSRGESAALLVGQKTGESQLATLRHDAQICASVRPLAQVDPRPVGVAVELLAPS